MEGSENMIWCSVRCIIEFRDLSTFEERVTLWRASSLGDAIELAEAEAREYATGLDGRYAGMAQAYGPIDGEPGHGVEVFSLMRSSSLDAAAYLSRFFDTGTEQQQS